MDSWDDLRVFLAVVRHRTHAAAARALGVDATTVGRRMHALESRLGARLVARTPGGFALTDAGAELAPHAEAVEAQVIAAERALSGTDARLEGPLRVTAGDGVSAFVLAPRLVAFRREHPGIRVEIRADNRMLDLSRREADLAIRLGRPREPALVARRLGTMRFALFAGEAYLDRAGRPRSVRELATHDWIGFDASLDRTAVSRWMRRHVPPSRWVVRSNATSVLVAACVAGHGLLLVPPSFTRGQQGLARLLPRAALPSAEIWAVTHPDLYPSARIKTALAWLAHAFAGDDESLA
jgi:DNA-binding transcriptional LysR family regulator